ncbi:MAG: hypothetical protein AABY95_11145 [Pseudomonadota bacterium]
MKLHRFAALALFTLTAPVWAATPAGGELSAETSELAWEGDGPYVFTNLTPQLGAGGQPPICEELQPFGCDIFTLTVNVSDKFRADEKNKKEVVTVGITFPQDPGGQVDYDLYIYDSSGTEVGSSADGAPQTSETVTFPLKALKNGDYSVQVIIFTPLGTDYSGVARIGRLGKSDTCTLPGIVLADDAAGDGNISPLNVPAAPGGGAIPSPFPSDDITQLAVAEPAGTTGLLAFTLKVASLAQITPQTRWLVSFTAPDGSTPYLAMSTADLGSQQAPIFEYGTSAGTPTPVSVGVYTHLGALDASSSFNADGTITLVLDPSLLGLKPGDKLDNVFAKVRRSLPEEAMNAGLTNDDTTVAEMPVSYTLAGNSACPAKSAAISSGNVSTAGKSGGLLLGAFGFPALFSFFGLALLRRRFI